MCNDSVFNLILNCHIALAIAFAVWVFLHKQINKEDPTMPRSGNVSTGIRFGGEFGMSDRVYSLDEAKELANEHDRRMDDMFRYNKSTKIMTIRVRYDYPMDLSEIKDRGDLLSKVLSLSEKNWMTAATLREFILRVCKIKGWDAY